MRLRTKIMIAVVPVTAAAVAGSVVAASVYLRRRRRRMVSSFLSSEVRNSLQDLCSLKAEDFIPDGLGTSLYQRRLETLTDRQLIGVYVVVTLVKVLRDRGTDIHKLSKDDLASNLLAVRDVTHNREDRHEMLRRLGSLGADTIHSMLDDALLIAKMAA